MTVVYPQSDDWDEWDETLHVDEFVKERVQRATQAAQRGHRELARGTQRLKRKQSDATDRHTDGAGCSWTQHEDAQLRKLVQEEGVGNWEAKASRFFSARTPNALRQRWCSYAVTTTCRCCMPVIAWATLLAIPTWRTSASCFVMGFFRMHTPVVNSVRSAMNMRWKLPPCLRPLRGILRTVSR